MCALRMRASAHCARQRERSREPQKGLRRNAHLTSVLSSPRRLCEGAFHHHYDNPLAQLMP
eukprot:CAMPEP_0180739822 /NCGR_PEP_ID=MMETSP1038_2-20121128/25547_1 /TAXON_ID=632150 /ORGANISM="Azadinium spinosum, Strain 3D9" /LENGTH=60 /DNA_ID=CAMNT_0022773053 /DNA_START=98 /DNA_END=277 /DNA_ORIENTATION=-